MKDVLLDIHFWRAKNKMEKQINNYLDNLKNCIIPEKQIEDILSKIREDIERICEESKTKRSINVYRGPYGLSISYSGTDNSIANIYLTQIFGKVFINCDGVMVVEKEDEEGGDE